VQADGHITSKYQTGRGGGGLGSVPFSLSAFTKLCPYSSRCFLQSGCILFRARSPSLQRLWAALRISGKGGSASSAFSIASFAFSTMSRKGTRTRMWTSSSILGDAMAAKPGWEGSIAVMSISTKYYY